MENSDSPFSLSSLLCQEDAKSCLNEQEGPSSTFESEEEYFHIKIQQEINFQSVPNSSTSVLEVMPTSWLMKVRVGAIQWILNTSEHFRFNFSTIFLSLSYFDRFISKRPIDNGKLWAIRLLSIACLSLAAKMEETNVPLLSQYHIKDEYSFDPKAIERMELLVLRTLEWRMCSITPLLYLHYFITKFSIQCSTPNELVSRATELLLGFVKVINLMDHRPSVIAAAAILAASDGGLSRDTVELKLSVISLWGSLEKENVFSCYTLMHETNREKFNTPDSIISPNLLSAHSNLGTSSSVPSSGTKRRLTYDDSDQSRASQRTHRQY